MQKGKFWKRLAMGCGAIVALCLITVLVFILAAVIDPAKPSEVKGIGLAETLPRNLEAKNGLPGNLRQAKPIRLSLDFQYAKLKVIRGDQLGEILVQGDFDQSNFELKTKIDEQPDAINYKIKFGGSHNWVSMMFGLSQDKIDPKNNAITIILPADAPIDMAFKLKMGETDMDLTGLAITGIDGELSMGKFTASMSEPNRGELDNLKYQMKMGESTWTGFENFGVNSASFSGRMGSLNVNAASTLSQDTQIDVDFSMGQVELVMPEDTKLDSKITVAMGEKRKPNFSGNVAENAPTLKVRGKVFMGEFNVYRLTEFEKQVSKATDLAINGSIEEAGERFRELKQKFPDEMGPDNLNNLGYRLMHRAPDRAIAVFRLNVELHPYYANGFDSLGEGLYEAGQLKEALENYRMALEMDPTLTSSGRMVAKIKRQLSGEEPLEEHTPLPPEPPEQNDEE